MNDADRIARLMILAVLFMSGILAFNQGAVASWLVNLAIPLRPLGNAPLYVAVNVVGRIGMSVSKDVVEVISSNRTKQLDRILAGHTYTAGNTSLASGTEIFLHVYSGTPGVVLYNEWYHVTIGPNEIVKRLRPGLATRDAPAPIGQFDEEDYGRMTRIATGEAEYWQISPAFNLYWRDRDVGDRRYVGFDLENPDGVSIRAATGAIAASGTPDAAAADFTARSSQVSLKLSVDLSDDVNKVYGRPMIFLGPPPDYAWRIGYLVIWVSFNNTGVKSSYLTANGWTMLSRELTPGYVDFFKVLPPLTGNLMGAGFATFDIPVDTSDLRSGVGVSVRLWVADLQIPADAAQGESDSAPRPNGAVAGYGVADTIFVNGFRISSNKPEGQLLWAVFKTA